MARKAARRSARIRAKQDGSEATLLTSKQGKSTTNNATRSWETKFLENVKAVGLKEDRAVLQMAALLQAGLEAHPTWAVTFQMDGTITFTPPSNQQQIAFLG
jgi:hypothetical protein